MEALKAIARFLWNFFVFCAMCVSLAATVMWWVLVVAPSRIYRHLREA